MGFEITVARFAGPSGGQSRPRSGRHERGAVSRLLQKITNSVIPDSFNFYWQPPPPIYDPAKAKKLLADAGYPNGFDAGLFYCDSSYSNIGEAAVDSLQQVPYQAGADRARRLHRGLFWKEAQPRNSSGSERSFRQCGDPACRLCRQWR